VVVGAAVVLVVAVVGFLAVVVFVLAAFEQPTIERAIPTNPVASPTVRLCLITFDLRQMLRTLRPERGESIYCYDPP
jgi:hypothetical protein